MLARAPRRLAHGRLTHVARGSDGQWLGKVFDGAVTATCSFQSSDVSLHRALGACVTWDAHWDALRRRTFQARAREHQFWSARAVFDALGEAIVPMIYDHQYFSDVAPVELGDERSDEWLTLKRALYCHLRDERDRPYEFNTRWSGETDLECVIPDELPFRDIPRLAEQSKLSPIDIARIKFLSDPNYTGIPPGGDSSFLYEMYWAFRNNDLKNLRLFSRPGYAKLWGHSWDWRPYDPAGYEWRQRGHSHVNSPQPLYNRARPLGPDDSEMEAYINVRRFWLVKFGVYKGLKLFDIDGKDARPTEWLSYLPSELQKMESSFWRYEARRSRFESLEAEVKRSKALYRAKDVLMANPTIEIQKLDLTDDVRYINAFVTNLSPQYVELNLLDHGLFVFPRAVLGGASCAFPPAPLDLSTLGPEGLARLWLSYRCVRQADGTHAASGLAVLPSDPSELQAHLFRTMKSGANHILGVNSGYHPLMHPQIPVGLSGVSVVDNDSRRINSSLLPNKSLSTSLQRGRWDEVLSENDRRILDLKLGKRKRTAGKRAPRETPRKPRQKSSSSNSRAASSKPMKSISEVLEQYVNEPSSESDEHEDSQ